MNGFVKEIWVTTEGAPSFLFALAPSVSSGGPAREGRYHGEAGLCVGVLPGDWGQLFYGLARVVQAVHKLPVPLFSTMGGHVGGDTAILTYIISIRSTNKPLARFGSRACPLSGCGELTYRDLSSQKVSMGRKEVAW